jgi:hypothetical protein
MIRKGWHVAATVFIAVAVLAATQGIAGATPKTVAQKCDVISGNTHLLYDDTTFHFDVDSAPAAVDVRTEVTITAHRGRAEGTTATAMAR